MQRCEQQHKNSLVGKQVAWKALVDFLRGVGMEAGAGTAAVGDDIKDGEGETETSLESKTSLVHESAGITGKI